jgi:hypothetical protein
MSEGNGWTQPGTILTILCIIGVFAAALVCAYRYSAKSTAMRQEFAEKQGWGFSRKDTEGLSAKIETFFTDQRFVPSNIVLIKSGDPTIRLFEYSHDYRGRRRSTDFGTGCIIQSPRFRANGAGTDNVEIVDRTRIDTALVFDQVDIGDSEFSQKFIVVSKNRIAAKNVVTPALQSALLRRREAPLYDPVTIEINATGAVVLHFGTALDPELWPDLIELCRKIETSMP